MTAIAPSSPMSCHVGDTTLQMMSAASANSSPTSSHRPNRRQTAFRSPWVALGVSAIHTSLRNGSSEPSVTTIYGGRLRKRLGYLSKLNEELFHAIRDRL